MANGKSLLYYYILYRSGSSFDLTMQWVAPILLIKKTSPIAAKIQRYQSDHPLNGTYRWADAGYNDCCTPRWVMILDSRKILIYRHSK